MLAFFGDNDLNIDVENSVSVYQSSFKNNNIDFSYRVFQNANHALTKAKYSNKTVSGLMDVLKINILGDEIFVDGVLEEITEFATSGSQN